MENEKKMLNDFKKLLKEWDYVKNNALNLKPDKLSYGSNKKAYWICSLGHSYFARIKQRVNGSGCPICAGKEVLVGFNDLLTFYPLVCEEWDYDKNKKGPQEYTKKSGEKVFWKCKNCGKSWICEIRSRTKNKTGCPNCSSSKQTSFPEQAIYYYIRKIYSSALNRYILPNKYTLDIFIPELKIGIEYDGIAWHSSKIAINRENIKNKFCIDNGIKLIRIKETDNKTNEIEIKDNIISYYRDKDDINLNKVIILLFNTFLKLNNIKKIDVVFDKLKILENYNLAKKENSLMIKFPEIALEWDYDKNEKISPDTISYGSSEEFYWKCKKGHSYKMNVWKRINGRNCPICSSRKLLYGFNDFETWCKNNKREDLLLEWYYDKNERKPKDYFKGYKKNDIYWKCKKCSYIWNASILDRSKGKGCPKCFKNNRYKKVIKYSISNQEIQRYDSISEASRINNIPISSISNACRGNANTAGGYIWKFEKSDDK